MMTSYKQTDSRQFTFFFALFVLFQIFNMVASRKIHDEFNICSGICDNAIFLIVWVFIIVLQVILTQFAGRIFEVHIEGLHILQWVQAAIIALTQFFVDFATKFIPDRMTPAMGADSVFDEREKKESREGCPVIAEREEERKKKLAEAAAKRKLAAEKKNEP